MHTTQGVEIIHRGKVPKPHLSASALAQEKASGRACDRAAKHDNGMDRCWLKGSMGDALHAVLCAAGSTSAGCCGRSCVWVFRSALCACSMTVETGLRRDYKRSLRRRAANPMKDRAGLDVAVNFGGPTSPLELTEYIPRSRLCTSTTAFTRRISDLSACSGVCCVAGPAHAGILKASPRCSTAQHMRRSGGNGHHGAPVAPALGQAAAQRLMGSCLGVRVFMAAASTVLAPITSRLRR